MNKILYKKLSSKASKKKGKLRRFQFIHAVEYNVGKRFCLQTTGCIINGTCEITQCQADGWNVTIGTFSNRKLWGWGGKSL